MKRPRPLQEIRTVTGADGVLLATNPQRKAWRISNCDLASVLWLGLNTPAVIGSGIQVPPSHPTLDVIGDLWGALAAGEVHAVAELLAAPLGTVEPFSAVGANLSGAAVASVLAFTVPAGFSGQLDLATLANFTGAPTVALQLIRGATTITLSSATAPVFLNARLTLQAGDTIQWAVTTPIAASHFDATLSGTLEATATVAPASINVCIWSLEDCGASY